MIVAGVTRIVVQEGQQTDVPCITEHPAFNKTNNVLKVWWFHQKPGRSLISNPFYTIDLTSSNQVLPPQTLTSIELECWRLRDALRDYRTQNEFRFGSTL